MTVINMAGDILPQEWAEISTAEEFNIDRPNQIISATIFKEIHPIPSRLDLGLRLPADVNLPDVADLLVNFAMVIVEFPKLRDGRGFTIGRELRKRYAYCGDIRAYGFVIPDVLGMLVSCGFSSIVIPTAHPVDQWRDFTRLATSENTSENASPLLHRMLKRGV